MQGFMKFSNLSQYCFFYKGIIYKTLLAVNLSVERKIKEFQIDRKSVGAGTGLRSATAMPRSWVTH